MLGSRVRAPKGAQRTEIRNGLRFSYMLFSALPAIAVGSVVRLNVKSAQRKIPVDLHFIVRLRHKASGAALGLSCAVCFEQPAGVFAGCGAVCQAKILASLKIKNGISLTPLN